MKNTYKFIDNYHRSFEGNTYDACARCGGKCEQFKISTLIPGEKEYMAKKLKMKVAELEEKYLSRINTPYGNADVLKMRDGCPFLDEEYRCTAIPAKPVLCDTYPVVFYLENDKVHFEIDRHDCPMVHWPEYKKAVDYFATRGIEVLKKLKIPVSWWKIVALYDEYDVAYKDIEKKLAKKNGYEEFYLESVLGFACNGYEKKARKQGLHLMSVRLRDFRDKALAKLNKFSQDENPKVKELARTYRGLIRGQINKMLLLLRNLSKDETVFNASNNKKYLESINEGLGLISQLEVFLKSFQIRLKEVKRIKKKTIKATQKRKLSK